MAAKPRPMAKSEAPPGIDGIAAEARACFRTHGQEGVVVARVTVDAEGRVTEVVPEGTLAATPSGACVADAVRRAKLEATGATRTFRSTFTLGPP